jgi:hypothetical protein
MTKKLILLVAAVGTATTVLGAGVASADQDYSGMKYSKALQVLQSMGATAQVSAKVGDRLDEPDCLVTSYTKSAMPAIGFTADGPSQVVLVALDCNGAVATPGNPGYSAASPEGRAVIQEQKKLEWMASDEGQSYCEKAERQHPDWAPIDGCHQAEE